MTFWLFVVAYLVGVGLWFGWVFEYCNPGPHDDWPVLGVIWPAVIVFGAPVFGAGCFSAWIARTVKARRSRP